MLKKEPKPFPKKHHPPSRQSIVTTAYENYSKNIQKVVSFNVFNALRGAVYGFIGGIVCLHLGFSFLFLNHLVADLWLFQGFVAVLLGAACFFEYRAVYKLSRSLFYLYAMAMVFFFAFFSQKEGLGHLLFIALSVSSLFLFSDAEKSKRWVGVSTGLLLFVGFEWLFLQVYYPTIIIDIAAWSTLRSINVVAFMLFILVFGVSHMKGLVSEETSGISENIKAYVKSVADAQSVYMLYMASSGEVLFVNQLLSHYLINKMNQPIPPTVFDLFNTSYQDEIKGVLNPKQGVAGSALFSAPLKKDPLPRQFFWRLFPMFLPFGENGSVLMIGFDVTNLQKTQILLINRLKQSLMDGRLKSKLLTSSHQHMLGASNAASGFSDMLLDYKTGGLNEKQKHYIIKIMEAIEDMSTQLETLAEMDDIDKIRSKQAFEPQVVRTKLEQAIARTKEVFESKNLMLKSEILLGEEKIYALEGLLEKIFGHAFCFAMTYLTDANELFVKAEICAKCVVVTLTNTCEEVNRQLKPDAKAELDSSLYFIAMIQNILKGAFLYVPGEKNTFALTLKYGLLPEKENDDTNTT